MIKDSYKRQVDLLLSVLPEVAKQEMFAVHGGTAINLFKRDIPRLSVDIDLTYLSTENRLEALTNINRLLENIMIDIKSVVAQSKVLLIRESCKLIVARPGATIKIEVNQINRGVLKNSKKIALCKTAQEMFNAFCEANIVSEGQLYGGKLCAALDRQHPRDLFDTEFILNEVELSPVGIKEGLLLCLLSSNRPLHELLSPNLINQRQVLENQFNGMTNLSFTYDEFEETRSKLISSIQGMFGRDDRQFLIDFYKLKPRWSKYPFDKFPAIQWKLRNLESLANGNPAKYKDHIERLENVFSIT